MADGVRWTGGRRSSRRVWRAPETVGRVPVVEGSGGSWTGRVQRGKDDDHSTPTRLSLGSSRRRRGGGSGGGTTRTGGVVCGIAHEASL